MDRKTLKKRSNSESESGVYMIIDFSNLFISIQQSIVLMHGKFLKILYSDSSFSNFPKASNLAKFLTFGAINASITHHSLKYNYAPFAFSTRKGGICKALF